MRFGSYPKNTYEAKQFTVANGQTNYDVESNEDILTEDHDYLRIASDEAITIRFNAIANDAIAIAADSAFVNEGYIRVTNIFITNASGNTATIDIEAI